ncbi:MAG TPA: hypothetical protein DHV36_07190 [Desulfobacteraceae bacterium]|nr:hypothetical protein [Desulfobacteraceae bacterium]|tara:strand:- start:739 stop:2091 length:1353 start_codon:yes stop_codon:yes gene_type:complete
MKKKHYWRLAGTGLLFTAVLAWQTGLVDKHLVSASTGTKATAGQAVTLSGQGEAKETEIKTVGVVTPRPILDTAAVVLPGRASAATQATLFFRVSGPLVKVHANPGDRVRKGDLLLELDDRDYRRQVHVVESQLKSARANLLKMQTGARPEDIRIIEASLNAAKADLELAQKELARHQVLYKNQAVTEQAYDRARTNVRSLSEKVASLTQQLARDKKGARKEDLMAARAGIEELTARLAIARDQLNDTRLTAPFDGVVVKRIPDAHEMVRQGESVMMLDDLSRLEIPVDVPENHIRSILALAHGKQKGSGRFTVRFLTTGDQVFPAELTEYSSRAHQATGTYEFVFSVTPAPEDLVFPGMTAEVHVHAGEKGKGSLAIPLQSLMGVAGNAAHVFRVDPVTRTAVRQPVVFESLAGGNEVAVISGLSGKDLVVAEGSAFIRQGEMLTYDMP